MTEQKIDSIVQTVAKIEGFLWDREIEFLVKLTEFACNSRLNMMGITIVELGSYCGKSTTAIGLVLKAVSPQSKIYAIDPHEGKLGIEDVIEQHEPTVLKFLKNIKDTNLEEIVISIPLKSYQVDWKKPIRFLFIDALHDYKNVSRDFFHFEPFVEVGGLVVFHDYAVYDGVTTFVDEILTSIKYEKVDQVVSTIALRKLA